MDLSDMSTTQTRTQSESTAAPLQINGELACWAGDRLSFDLLQQRLAAGPARAHALAAPHPASYVVFDLLAASSVDLRGFRSQGRSTR
jgi:ATP-dependent DNA ligase